MKIIIAIALGLGLSGVANAQDLKIEVINQDTNTVEYTEHRTLTERETDRVLRPVRERGSQGIQGTCGQLISSVIEKYRSHRYVGDRELAGHHKVRVGLGSVVQGLVAHCTTTDHSSAIPDVNACANDTPIAQCEDHGQSWASANCTWDDLNDGYVCPEYPE